MSLIAMIPARIGSTRLKMKNLALINRKPMIYYAIKAAKDSGVFDRIILNSDHDIFGEIAKRYDVEFYKRPVELGSSATKSDDVVYDFIKQNPCDIVAWVNPTSPLQTGEELRQVIEYFKKEKLDSLITVKNEQVHAVFENQPVNFNIDEQFAQTQDLEPVQPFVYSVMMWNSAAFINEFDEKGYAFFCGKTGYFPVGKLSSFIIKNLMDLMTADYVLKSLEKSGDYNLEYDSLADMIP